MIDPPTVDWRSVALKLALLLAQEKEYTDALLLVLDKVKLRPGEREIVATATKGLQDAHHAYMEEFGVLYKREGK